MPIIRGSSSVKSVFRGPDGPGGTVGPSGPVGPTGETGRTGTGGTAGKGISGAVSFGSDGITFTFTDGSTLELTGFQGSGTAGIDDLYFQFTNAATGATDGFFYKDTVTSGDGGEGFSGQTARFRTLELRGNRISVLGNTLEGLTLQGLTTSGIIGPTGELLYLRSGNSASNSTKNNTFINDELTTVTNLMIERAATISGDISAGEIVSDTLRSNMISILNNFQETIIGGLTGTNKSIQLGTGAPGGGGISGGASRPFTRYNPDGFTLSAEIDLGVTAGSQLIYSFENVGKHGSTGDDLVNAVGSCCFCSSPDVISGEYGTQCFDYSTKKYCDAILGSFSTTPCALRTEGPDCKETHPCCVNGKCVDTNAPKCSEFGGVFFPDILNCEIFNRPEEDGGRGLTCSNICPLDGVGACCLNGVCYSFNSEQCDSIGGIFHAGQSCDPYDENYYNCCLDLFPGACCNGALCVGEYSPLQCATLGGFYQGAGTVCSGTYYDEERDESYGVVTLADGINQRLCCRDPEDVGNYNCRQAINPCNQPIGSQILSQVDDAVFIGYLGAPAETCNPLPCTGTPIPDLANSSTSTPITYYPTVGSQNSDSVCPCDHIHPVQYTTDLSDYTASSINYVRGHMSELGFLTASPDQELGLDASDGSKFNEYADKIYGEGYTIHRRWALFVKKDDENNSNNVSWGLPHGIGINTQKPTDLWATSVLDGLVNTRLYDSSSIDNNIWFSPNVFGFDPDAYDRWRSLGEGNNLWPDEVNENNIENFENEFNEAYRNLWENNNTNTAMGAVSVANATETPTNLDWYVPSIVELNHIYANQSQISDVQDWSPLSASRYWSSTSGLAGSHNFTQANEFELDASYNISVLSEEQKYRIGSAQWAYTQDFGNGSVQSDKKENSNAKVRLVRRVPIYVVSKYCYTPNSFPDVVQCNSCGPCPCGEEQIV